MLLTSFTARAENAPAQPAAPAPAQPYRIFIEPAALARPASAPLEGARATVFTPMRQQHGRFVPWGREEFERLRIGPDAFLQRAIQVADRDLPRVRVQRLRHARHPEGGEYVLITSDEPVVAALMLVPRLPRWLAPALGEKQWLVAPDQYTLYVFSAGSPILETLGPEIAAQYDNAVWPATLEVFEWTPESGQPTAVATLGAAN